MLGFFYLNSSSLVRCLFVISLALPLLLSIAIASWIPSIWHRVTVEEPRLWIKVISAFSALGVCWAQQKAFCSLKFLYEKELVLNRSLSDLLSRVAEFILPLSIFGAICALFFVYAALIVFWEKFSMLVLKAQIFDDISRSEIIIYSLMLLVLLVATAVAFMQSKVFYDPGRVGTLYAFDSPFSNRTENLYLVFCHTSNDIRQPLFAIFAAPFIGIPYLVAKIIGASLSVQAILVNAAQLVMFLMANFMLAKLIAFTPAKRLCFMLLIGCTYTNLLSVFTMEQYIIAYFWLIFCVYLICKRKLSRFALCATGGTLLTSMSVLLFMTDKSPTKNFKVWMSDIWKRSFEFVTLLFACGRSDVILGIVPAISNLMVFTGQKVAFSDKIYQYIVYIKNYFFVPEGGVNFTKCQYITWSLVIPTGINLAGVVILFLCIVSAVLNREKKISRIALGWILFSFFVLFIIGWGTAKNELILYSLYFGWPLMVLLFQLFEKIVTQEKLFAIACIGIAVVLFAFNVLEILEVLRFSVTFYPALR